MLCPKQQSLRNSRKKPRRALPPPRTNLKPRLQPGDVIRYRLELQTTSETTTHTGAISDPQGPSQLVVTWDAVVRLEVLGAPPSASEQNASTQASPGVAPGLPQARALPAKSQAPAPSAIQAMRIRTVYEKSAATVQSDTPDPAAEGIQKQYGQLEGHSIEFTLGADGHISDVRGLEGVVSDDKARSAAEQWLAQISGKSSAPAGGIVPGQNWTSEEAAASMPLAGLFWRTDSSYVRNESCQAANPRRQRWRGRHAGSRRRVLCPHPLASHSYSAAGSARSHARGVPPQRFAHQRPLDRLGRKPELRFAEKRLGS